MANKFYIPTAAREVICEVARTANGAWMAIHAVLGIVPIPADVLSVIENGVETENEATGAKELVTARFILLPVEGQEEPLQCFRDIVRPGAPFIARKPCLGPQPDDPAYLDEDGNFDQVKYLEDRKTFSTEQREARQTNNQRHNARRKRNAALEAMEHGKEVSSNVFDAL